MDQKNPKDPECVVITMVIRIIFPIIQTICSCCVYIYIYIYNRNNWPKELRTSGAGQLRAELFQMAKGGDLLCRGLAGQDGHLGANLATPREFWNIGIPIIYL